MQTPLSPTGSRPPGETTMPTVLSKSEATSLASIAGALVPTSVTAVVFIVAFLILRPRYRFIYARRTYFRTIPEKDRTPCTSTSSTTWYRDFYRLDDKFILRHHSLDAYLFLRFFRVIILICFVGCCLTWPVLFPVNATGGGSSSQLDRLGFGNVTDGRRLWAHTVVAWLFSIFVLLLITRERVFLIGMRQAYMTTIRNSNRLSSRTVLFLAVPPEALEEGNLQQVFGDKAKRSWPVPKLEELEKLVSKRNKHATDLEEAEVKCEENVVQVKRKEKETSTSTNGGPERDGASLLASDPAVRPTHRTPVPLVGQKLDSIDHLLDELPSTVEKIEEARRKYSENKLPLTDAMFVEFEDQFSAHQAYQQVQHHSIMSLQPKYIGVVPKDIYWQNLTMDPVLRISYGYAGLAVIVATIVLWSIPVGIIGTITKIDYLTEKFKFLHFINQLPPSVLSFIKGFLPPFVLSFLVSYVPYWFRGVAWYSGVATAVEAERTTQIWYFVFQFVQVFLVTTFSSVASALLSRVANEPAKIPVLLAKYVPGASTFYLTYFILQGLTSAPKNVLNYSDVAMYILGDTVLDKTPRQKYDRLSFMRGMFWGNQYPKFTNLAVISIAYSCVSPLVLGFATIGFAIFYVSWRYQLLYMRNAKLDTMGECYGRALQQLLTGVYVSEFTLLGLFGTFGAGESKGPTVLIIILIIGTIVYHVTVNKYLNPYDQFIPLDVLQQANEADSASSSADPNTANDEESAPLLSSSNNDNGDRDSSQPTTSGSKVKKIGSQHLKLPPSLLDPLAAFLEPHIFASAGALKPSLSDDRTDPNDPNDPRATSDTNYTDDQIKNAYLHPALTSKTPLIWIPKDAHGVSDELKKRNEKAGVKSSDEGATLNEKGELKWDKEDLSKAPVFKRPVLY